MGALLKLKTADDTMTRAETWVEAFVTHGDGCRAVDEAGYNYSTQASRAAIASQNKKKYQAQILQRTRDIIASNAPAAIHSLVQLAADGQQESTRVTACKAILAMSGMDEPDTSAKPSDARSDAELIESIGQLIEGNDTIKQALVKYIK